MSLGVQREQGRFDGQGRGGGQHSAGTNPGQQLRQNQKTRWNHIWFRNAISSARPFQAQLCSCAQAHASLLPPSATA